MDKSVDFGECARRRRRGRLGLPAVLERLDEEKFNLLRHWGEGLLNDPRDEVRAAGKAILLLTEEIEHLHVDLWHARSAIETESGRPGDEVAAAELDFLGALRASIARLHSRESPAPSA